MPPGEDTIQISISSWIILDGGQENFRQGEERSFAIEFCADSPCATDYTTPGLLERVSDCQYHGVCRVDTFSSGYWIVDFGFKAYGKDRPLKDARRDSLLEGFFFLGVDPFFYFADLLPLPEIPPLVYRWRIERILLDTGPRLETRIPGIGKCMIRDPDRKGVREIGRTDAWKDDGGNADYILVCRLLDIPPQYGD